MAVSSNWVSKPVTDTIFTNIVNEFATFDINEGPWIAGGAVRKLWQGLSWNDGDIDIFFKNKEQFIQFSSKLKARAYQDNRAALSALDFDSKFISKNLYINSFDTSNASTFTITGLPWIDRQIKIQGICKQFYNSAENLVEDFDWTVCQIVSDGTTMWASINAVDDLLKHNLVLSSTTKRKIKIGRLIKYSAYGFNINDETMINVLSEIAIGNIESLIDDDY